MRSQGAGTLQEFEAALDALGDVREITVSMFSEGGEVFTGMAIANLLLRHPAQKVCIIDGLCASAATYVAMACHEIRIPSNAWMMIHGSTGGCYGGAGDLRAYADMLDQINSTAVNTYVARTGLPVDEITTMLAAETWMNGEAAVAAGFADTVLEPLQNLAARAGTLQPTNIANLRNVPAEALALFDIRNHATPNRNPSSRSMTPVPPVPAATPAPAARPGGQPLGAIQLLSGGNAGKELELAKPLTTLGKPGVQVAVLTRRPQGYFITHVEGAQHPTVNGQAIGSAPHALKDHDLVEIAGIKMEFFLKG